MRDSYTVHLDAANKDLRAAQKRLAEEIQSYPTPISGCDAQFNHLLAQRARISDALSALGSQPFVATPRMLCPTSGVESR